VGDRVAAFRALGAKVIAIEPQPLMATTLRILYGWRGVTVIQKAVGSRPGKLNLRINSSNPTISSASDNFIHSAAAAEGWHDQVWNKSIVVDVMTLDMLISKYGRPRFIKIDVEGLEGDVLAGLSNRVDGLSFEFITMQRANAHACIDRCSTLGFKEFNSSLGETQHLATWRGANEMHQWLSELDLTENSGDIYAR
jgi:FkbM family methyltransferase